MVDKKILPVFGKIPINEITPKDIRKWQNGLTAYRDKNGKPYAQTYLRAINNQLTAMFNYAVKYYDLRENPCTKAGSMGKSNAEEMQFWTKAEFEQFITAVQDKPASYTAFKIFIVKNRLQRGLKGITNAPHLISHLLPLNFRHLFSKSLRIPFLNNPFR